MRSAGGSRRPLPTTDRGAYAPAPWLAEADTRRAHARRPERAGLLHHFPSKEHLLLELLALRHEHDGERVARALAGHEGLLDAVLGLCRENQGTPGLVRLFAIIAAESVDDDHPAHGWMVDRYRTPRARMAARIEIEQREGRIDPALDPATGAAELLAMWDGLQIQWLLDPGAVDMTAVFAAFLGRLRPAIGQS